jgi:hypothetical protein
VRELDRVLLRTRGGGMKAEQARLIRIHGQPIEIRYIAHGLWFNGVPSYFEVHGVTERFDRNEVVELETFDGRVFKCVVLDSTPACTVIATL